jgi:hypothetical protein
MSRAALALAVAFGLGVGCGGEYNGAGTIEGGAVPAAVVAERAAVDAALAPPRADGAKQILFGDLHVHTTFSVDAFVMSLPILQGEGTHPPADACDFARYCSALDFWSINDHAEGITPDHWRQTKESIRQCNALAGDPANPDVVAFLGWEWTQVGLTAADHYGHKNVIFRDLEEDQVPKRPIAALSPRVRAALRNPLPLRQQLQFPLLDIANRGAYFDFGRLQSALRATPLCPPDVHTRELPEGCAESADTPQNLYRKLTEWGFDSIVIPHGTTWGLYTPPDATWDKQLTAAQHDPEKQVLTEEYRDWRPVAVDAQRRAVCPAPTPDYLPCCWQAGELIRARCGDVAPTECERRVAEARQRYVDAGMSGHRTVPGATVEDWKDCGQCRDCFNPAFNYRPANSVQYTLAITNFDDAQQPRRFRFGFIASSDNHKGRPGTGYKEYGRRMMTEAVGPRSPFWRRRLGLDDDAKPATESVAFDAATLPIFLQADVERQASFFLTGGLVAVHAEHRDRDAIWHALKRREVYGTSGERMLLWFDVLNAPSGPAPMGSEVALTAAPVFRVRAVGSFKQAPGCPAYALTGLGPERLERLCRGECYNPTDERHRITRNEIVRIRAQQQPGEAVGPLIEDPWRRFDCPPAAEGCTIEFDDPEFAAGGGEAVYYARAIQEPTLAVNAANLRCRPGPDGECAEVRPCYGDYRTPFEEDCLEPNEERAWSSPIYVLPASAPS